MSRQHAAAEFSVPLPRAALACSCRYPAKGLSPWLRERMMLRAFPLLEGPEKARAAL